MPAPRLVLLDEPCAGVNPSLVDQLRELLVELNKAQGGSFVVIEHNMDFIMRLCPHVICMVEGKVLAEGPPASRAIEPAGARGLSWELSADSHDKTIEFDKVVAGYTPSLTILNETTLDARKGEITLLIGPNGAGKSTVLKTLFGLLTPRSGEVRFEGRSSTAWAQRELLAERHRVRAAGTQPLRLAVGAPQPRARRHHAAARRAARAHRGSARALPAHPRAHRQPGLDDVGRRAEAARGRARAAAAPARAPDRRAFDRPVAASSCRT